MGVSHADLPGIVFTNIDRDILPLRFCTMLKKYLDRAYVAADGIHLNKLE
jgi:hypothetical protein